MSDNNNPFPCAEHNKRYYTYDYAMKQRFGGKTAKLTVDGGFTCPNIDGTKGVGGCAYCSQRPLPERGLPIREQIRAAKEKALIKWGGQMTKKRFIVYFQTFTNTYAPQETLRKLYEEALSEEDIVGISIGTRADCVSEETAAYFRRLSEQTFVTVELGLQTVHEETARRINRCHTYEEFLAGFRRLEGVSRCVHLIDGLPGENEEMMLETARKIGRLHPEQLKFHLLYIAKGTEMEKMYRRGEVRPLAKDEYVNLLVHQLESIPPDIVVGRVTGDALAEELIAPVWSRRKVDILNEIDKTFVKKDTWQGKLYNIYK